VGESSLRRLLIGLLVTALCGVLLARAVDWSHTFDLLKGADVPLVALATLCLLGSLAAKTARWRLLLPNEAPVSFARLYRVLHISFFLNNVLPARLGDVARVAATSRHPGLRVGHVLSSLLTERITDTVTLMAAFILVSPFLLVPDDYRGWLEVAWLVIGITLFLAVLLAVFHRPMSNLKSYFRLAHVPINQRFRDEARFFHEGWRQLFAGRRQMAGIWCWSAVAWVGAFAINYFLMRALEIDAPLTVAVLITCTTNLAMLVPSSPGYIGVFHAAATVSLLPFGVDRNAALSFAILAHLVNVLPVSLLGATFLVLDREPLGVPLPFSRRSSERVGGRRAPTESELT
jgi:uncharacterized protein (TIRG00374 family)